MNSFLGTGYVGTKPELRTVVVEGGERRVCHFRFYSDHRVPDGKGSYVDQGGLWFRVTVWGRRAEHVARVIDKGMLVQVMGTVHLHRWRHKDTGEEHSELRIDAARGSVTLVLMFVDQVQTTPRQGKSEGLESVADADPDDQPDEGSVPLEPATADGEEGESLESAAQSAGSTDSTDVGSTRKGGRQRVR